MKAQSFRILLAIFFVLLSSSFARQESQEGNSGYNLILAEEHMPKTKILELMKYLSHDRDREVVFYCRQSSCTRSPMAARWALALGYRNIWRYEGGWEEWSEKKLPVEK
jgi:rhodanese-related sulfurtransferase